MSLPDDLKAFHAENERKLEVLDTLLGVAIGTACVYLAAVIVLGLA